MTIGDGIAYGTAWVCAAAAWIAWLWFKAPKHRHKWKEGGESFDRMRGEKMIGRRIMRVCEECGEPRSFDI